MKRVVPLAERPLHRWECSKASDTNELLGKTLKLTLTGIKMSKQHVYQRSDYDYFASIDSLWKDMDALGHINHTVYLTYMETVRMRYRKHLGIDDNRRDAKIGYILASVKIDYIRQARHPATFDIGERICRVGNSSFDTLTAVFIEDEDSPVVQARFTLVAYSYTDEMTVSVPDAVRKACRCL